MHSIRAKLVLRQALSNLTRGRQPEQTTIDQCNASFAKMQQDINKWPDKGTKVRSLISALSDVHQMNTAAINKLTERVDTMIKEINQQESTKSKVAYHQWVARSLENGAGIAHKMDSATA